jgi:hypothetical protein
VSSVNLKETLGKQYKAAQDGVETVRASWYERELIALTKLSNADQKTRKSRISIGDLSTIVLERSGRTVAQLPSGKVRAASKVDEGNTRIIELALQRYVLPNANDQFPMSVKMFLVDYLSDVYGGLDVLSYWRIDDEYVGPDCMILNPRSVFWQAGKGNHQQAEYVFVSTFVTAKWLEDKKKLSTWNSQNINKVLKQAKESGSAKPTSREDSQRKSANDQIKNSTASWGDTQEFELVTKYERGNKGRWISFLPDYDCEVIRDIENPDESGRIPVIRKLPQLPFIDSIYGQGAIERGESLQKTLDSVTNLTHDGIKYSIYPIQKYNGSLVKRSTLKYQPGAFWNMSDLSAVEPYTTGNTALNTFLPIQQFLTAKMLNQNGTTSTQISETDQIPGYGKTPEAIKSQQARESTMDRLSRDRLEAFYGELIEHWIGLLTTKQEAPLEFYVYDEEINELRSMGADVDVNKGAKTRTDMDGEEKIVFGTGKLTIPKGKLKGHYKYIVDTGSSMLKDDSEEHEKLGEVLMTLLKIGPDQINQWLAQEGQSISLAALLKRWIITGGAKDWDEIIQDAPQDMGMGIDPMTGQPIDPMQAQMAQEQAMQQQMMQEQAMQQQMMAQQPPQQPMQPMGQYQPDPFTEQIVQQIKQQGGF